jgi:dihydrodipicolinate synthase/N-acetylneuraminate lyase
VIGVKDSQNDLVFARQLAKSAEDQGAALQLLLGSRTLVDAMKVLGVRGAITGLANIVPHACVEAYEAAKRGDWATAEEAQRQIDDAGQLTKVAAGSNHSSSFGGMKAALKAMGVIAYSTVAAPLRSPSPEEEERIAELTRSLKLRQPIAA